MNNIYYKIWADAIQSFRKYHPNRTDWRITLLIFITWIHALNFWTIVLWLKYFNIYNISYFTINLFPGEMINGFLSFTIEFAMPFGIINYFLIFYNKRYELIIKKNKNNKIKYALIYSLVILLTTLISANLYGVLTN